MRQRWRTIECLRSQAWSSFSFFLYLYFFPFCWDSIAEQWENRLLQCVPRCIVVQKRRSPSQPWRLSHARTFPNPQNRPWRPVPSPSIKLVLERCYATVKQTAPYLWIWTSLFPYTVDIRRCRKKYIAQCKNSTLRVIEKLEFRSSPSFSWIIISYFKAIHPFRISHYSAQLGALCLCRTLISANWNSDNFRKIRTRVSNHRNRRSRVSGPVTKQFPNDISGRSAAAGRIFRPVRRAK